MSDYCITQPTVSQGEITPQGLRGGGRITEVTLNSNTWTPLPPIPLTSRNALAVQNQSAVDIKTNFGNPSGFVGMLLQPGTERAYDITDQIILFAKCQSGTAIIAVEELA